MTATELAREHPGLKLNCPGAVAPITAEAPEGLRDRRSSGEKNMMLNGDAPDVQVNAETYTGERCTLDLRACREFADDAGRQSNLNA